MLSHKIWETLENETGRTRYRMVYRQLKKLWWRAFRIGACVGCIAGFLLWYLYMGIIYGGLPQ